MHKSLLSFQSKECGPLQLHDINPSFGCCQNETKVFILSFFKLVHDVKVCWFRDYFQFCIS